MNQETAHQILNDPVAQELLHSSIPGRFAYTALDGTPRVVPVGFYWNGEQIVIGTASSAPKVRALKENPKVAMTIDTNTQPPHVLLVRGVVSVEIVDGVPHEYIEGARKLVPEENWDGWEATVHGLYDQMALITITPEWAKVMDFETRIPDFVRQLAEAKFAASPPEAAS